MIKKALLRRILPVILMLLMLCQPVIAATTQESTAVTQGCLSPDAGKSIMGDTQIISNCQSVILYELNNDTMMHAWNPDASVYPASFVKVMTALLVVEKGTMTDAVTIRQSVLDTVDYDAITAGLVADEVLTVEDLLYCMMVASANDAAAVLATHIMGSQEKFVAEMNRYAKDLGCTGTNFVNVHGLHHSEQVTTARDMLRILKHATDNELFNKFFNAAKYTVPATNKKESRNLSTNNFLMNSNDLEIYYDSRVIGGRTGETAYGDRCVATVAKQGGMKLLCIITGAKSTYGSDGYSVRTYGGFAETSQLLDLGFNGYSAVQLFHADQALEQVSVSGGESDVVLGVSSNIYTVLPKDADLNSIQFSYSEGYNQLSAPIKKGTIIGTVSIWHSGICIGETELYAMNSVSTEFAKEDEDGRKWKPITVIFLTIVILVLAACSVLLIIRWSHTIRVLRMQRRHRRRRSR